MHNRLLIPGIFVALLTMMFWSPPTEAQELSFKQALSEGLEHRAFKDARVSMSVMDCSSGAELFSSNGDLRLNPASNLKLFTAVTALDVLGPAYRFRTQLFRDGPIEGGVIKGSVYVLGGGDPELVYEEVWKLSLELSALGITKIEGDLVFDESFFDDVRRIPNWVVDGDDYSRAYFAPLGALSFNFNTVAIVVRPGANPGDLSVVSLDTPTQHVKLVNEATTVAGRRGRGLKAEIVSGTVPLQIKVTGRVGQEQSPRRFYRAIEQPVLFASDLLLDQLDKQGIEVMGIGRSGVVPAKAESFHSVWSSSMDVILKYMNKLSSNFIAEQTLKTISATVNGAPGSTQGGLQVVQSTLEARGVWESGMILKNGSGLSVGSRVSAQDFTRLLINVEKDPRLKWEFISSLPIAGVDGTLRSRMSETEAKGMVRAKTGSLDGVYAMSGYAIRSSGDMVAFSILANDLSTPRNQVRSAMEQMIQVMVEEPDQEALTVNEEQHSGSGESEGVEVTN